jgi:hypothetical protein
MQMRIRVLGVNAEIRRLANISSNIHTAAREGVMKAAEHLKKVIEDKHGEYQPGWARLAPSTVDRKMRNFGISDSPLIETGAMRDSYFIQPATTATAISAQVKSNDPKLEYHVYGTSRMPARDPFLITRIEEKDRCIDIIKSEIMKVMNSGRY